MCCLLNTLIWVKFRPEIIHTAFLFVKNADKHFNITPDYGSETEPILRTEPSVQAHRWNATRADETNLAPVIKVRVTDNITLKLSREISKGKPEDMSWTRTRVRFCSVFNVLHQKITCVIYSRGEELYFL